VFGDCKAKNTSNPKNSKDFKLNERVGSIIPANKSDARTMNEDLPPVTAKLRHARTSKATSVNPRTPQSHKY
jgi:hypothetical protein